MHRRSGERLLRVCVCFRCVLAYGFVREEKLKSERARESERKVKASAESKVCCVLHRKVGDWLRQRGAIAIVRGRSHWHVPEKEGWRELRREMFDMWWLIWLFFTFDTIIADTIVAVGGLIQSAWFVGYQLVKIVTVSICYRVSMKSAKLIGIACSESSQKALENMSTKLAQRQISKKKKFELCRMTCTKISH
jgi:hypothetical protein